MRREAPMAYTELEQALLDRLRVNDDEPPA
jgi:hypothetical protein